MSDTFLRDTLAATVPLCIHDIKRTRDGISDYDLERVEAFAWELAEHGDELLYRSRKSGETSRLFSRFAECIAILAFMPGGVTIMGMHFEVPPAASPSET